RSWRRAASTRPTPVRSRSCCALRGGTAGRVTGETRRRRSRRVRAGVVLRDREILPMRETLRVARVHGIVGGPGPAAEPRGPVVGERLLDTRLVVHDERPV